MKNQSFNILFIMRSTRIKKNGLASIYARITTGGMRQELYTPYAMAIQNCGTKRKNGH